MKLNEGLESNASTGSSTASPITFEDTPLKICHLEIRPRDDDHIGHGVMCLEIVKGEDHLARRGGRRGRESRDRVESGDR
jgi:hypothetical protein